MMAALKSTRRVRCPNDGIDQDCDGVDDVDEDGDGELSNRLQR